MFAEVIVSSSLSSITMYSHEVNSDRLYEHKMLLIRSNFHEHLKLNGVFSYFSFTPKIHLLLESDK